MESQWAVEDQHFNTTPTRAAPNQQLLSPVSWALVHLQAYRKTYGFITRNFYWENLGFQDLAQHDRRDQYLHCFTQTSFYMDFC